MADASIIARQFPIGRRFSGHLDCTRALAPCTRDGQMAHTRMCAAHTRTHRIHNGHITNSYNAPARTLVLHKWLTQYNNAVHTRLVCRRSEKTRRLSLAASPAISSLRLATMSLTRIRCIVEIRSCYGNVFRTIAHWPDFQRIGWLALHSCSGARQS